MAIRSISVHPTKLYKYWYFAESDRYLNNVLDTDYLDIHWGINDQSSTWMCALIEDLAPTLKNYALDHVEAVWRFSSPSRSPSFQSWALPSKFVEYSGPKPTSGINATGCPRAYVSGPIAAPGQDVSINTFSSSATYISKGQFAYLVTKYKAMLFTLVVTEGQTALAYSSLLNGGSPTITVYYDDSRTVPSEIATVSGMTSGYRNPRNEQNVSWTLKTSSSTNYFCVGDFQTENATLYWRVSGAGSWNSIAATASAESITIPANTFPAESTIEWYISVTDTNGCTSTSSTFTFSTTDGTSIARPISPANMMVNGGIDNEFTWYVTNTTGQPHTRSVGFWADEPDAETWTEFFDVQSSASSCIVPAGTFYGGTVYWKVQTYNQDGVAGPLSDAVAFSSVAPPETPVGVVATQVPFATLSWQSDGQRAYEVSVDGKVVKKAFGSDIYSYKLQEPLEDGMHTLSIRIQGAYGLWSASVSAPCNVENVPDADIVLSGKFDIDGDLSWIRSVEKEFPNYWVYRDDVRIGHTNRALFTDQTVLGTHSYHILEELDDGNYNRSPAISGSMKSCITRIAQLGGAWLDLALSENSNSTQMFSWSKPATIRHMSGAKYPVAELSAFEDRIAAYDCAFSNVETARALEALRGKTVIIKSRGGEVVIGPMTAIEKTAGTFYISYRFSIQQTHWEDYIDDSDS